MKNIDLKNFKILILFIILFIFTNNDQAYAHLIDGKEHKLNGVQEHKPLKCIPEEKRHQIQRIFCKSKRKNHSLCKADIQCTLIELEKQKQNVSDAEAEIDKQKKENEELEKKLGDMTICTDITFNHKTAKSSKLFRAPNNNSLVITELKKDEEILFISPSSKDRKWYFVLTRANNICNSGYIEQKFVIKVTDDEDIVIENPKKVAKSETISIISPEWTEKGKLIEVNASGIQTIRGWVDENKIDEVIVDEKARPIQSNGTFSFNVFIKKDTKEIRITGNKNGKKVQSLIFKIRVGN